MGLGGRFIKLCEELAERLRGDGRTMEADRLDELAEMIPEYLPVKPIEAPTDSGTE